MSLVARSVKSTGGAMVDAAISVKSTGAAIEAPVSAPITRGNARLDAATSVKSVGADGVDAVSGVGAQKVAVIIKPSCYAYSLTANDV